MRSLDRFRDDLPHYKCTNVAFTRRSEISRVTTVQYRHYNATVSEDAAIGTTVLTLTASDLDLDRNGKVTYLLEMTSSDVDHFLIDGVTGDLTVAR